MNIHLIVSLPYFIQVHGLISYRDSRIHYLELILCNIINVKNAINSTNWHAAALFYDFFNAIEYHIWKM